VLVQFYIVLLFRLLISSCWGSLIWKNLGTGSISDLFFIAGILPVALILLEKAMVGSILYQFGDSKPLGYPV